MARGFRPCDRSGSLVSQPPRAFGSLIGCWRAPAVCQCVTVLCVSESVCAVWSHKCVSSVCLCVYGVPFSISISRRCTICSPPASEKSKH